MTSRLCAVRVCVYASFIWAVTVVFSLMWHGGRAPPAVTFDLCHAPPALTLAHPTPSGSVNEVEDPLRAMSSWRRGMVGDCVEVVFRVVSLCWG